MQYDRAIYGVRSVQCHKGPQRERSRIIYRKGELRRRVDSEGRTREEGRQEKMLRASIDRSTGREANAGERQTERGEIVIGMERRRTEDEKGWTDK